MSDILLRIQMFMDKVNNGTASIDEKYVNNFAEDCRKLINDKISEGPREFTLRVSNLGRPFCTLWMDKNNLNVEPNDLFFPSKMIFGSMIEAMAVAIIKSAGINVEGEQVPVTTKDGIKGTLDIIIDGRVYDVKSCSAWAWANKFHGHTFEDFYKTDTFGYVAQLIQYSDAIELPVGGFIVVNKETGQFHVMEADYTEEFRQKVLINVRETKKAIQEEKPFERCFSDQPEHYYKNPTGNRILSSPCIFCKHKAECWPNLQLVPQISSKAKERKLVYYTYIQPTQD